METLTVGSLAYYDSLSGLIPCKVIAIDGQSGNPSSNQNVTFKLTADRRGYTRGEVMTAWSLHVIPRNAVAFRKYSAVIRHYHVIGQ